MLQVRKYLLVGLLVLTLGCSMLGQSVPPTKTAIPSVAATDTVAALDTATAGPETETPMALPGETSAAPTTDPAQATLMASMGSMGVLISKGDIAQYMHPVGAPLKTWHDVPIMPQATAGQEFGAGIYSYTAAATLDQAGQFYAARVKSLGTLMGPATGQAGTGSQANHSITYLGYQLSLVLTSFDNDPNHVVVIISVAG
jgi:hypothetical protein